MSTEPQDPGVDPLERADSEAVYRYAFEGKPLDPEVARRVHERAARVTEHVLRTRPLVDDEQWVDITLK